MQPHPNHKIAATMIHEHGIPEIWAYAVIGMYPIFVANYSRDEAARILADIAKSHPEFRDM